MCDLFNNYICYLLVEDRLGARLWLTLVQNLTLVVDDNAVDQRVAAAAAVTMVTDGISPLDDDVCCC